MLQNMRYSRPVAHFQRICFLGFSFCISGVSYRVLAFVENDETWFEHGDVRNFHGSSKIEIIQQHRTRCSLILCLEWHILGFWKTWHQDSSRVFWQNMTPHHCGARSFGVTLTWSNWPAFSQVSITSWWPGWSEAARWRAWDVLSNWSLILADDGFWDWCEEDSCADSSRFPVLCWSMKIVFFQWFFLGTLLVSKKFLPKLKNWGPEKQSYSPSVVCFFQRQSYEYCL